MKNALRIISLSLLLFILPAPTREDRSYHPTYEFNPDNTSVNNVKYDEQLNVVRVNIHAIVSFGFIKININEWYGIKIKDKTDIEKKIKEILGDIEIIHLRQIDK